ncbi:MAG: DUF4286 family protein [Bacteroidetes bacterium]|nr:DUF4286 family protein [Bacteroidota bacterium]
MIVYNVTVKITPEIETEWIKWQKEEHIPEVMASGFFTDYQFYRLLHDEEDGITYIVQYFAKTMSDYDSYAEQKAPELRKKSMDKWGNRFIAFRTVMKVVD